MARNRATQRSYVFNKGLVTDANPLAFPENTCTSISNYLLASTGHIRPRDALVLEPNHDTTRAIDIDESTRASVSWVKWQQALPGIDVLVLKVGDKLHFRKISADGVFTSSSFTSSIALPAVVPFTQAEVINNTVSFSTSAGYLIVVGKYIEAQHITLDATTYGATATNITIKERDFEGIDDTADPATRPDTLTDSHRYNLVNRGWTDSRIDEFYDKTKTYPALADLVSFGFYDKPTSGREYWDATKISQEPAGTGPALSGRILLETMSGVAKVGGLQTITRIRNIYGVGYTAGSLTFRCGSFLTGSLGLSVGDFVTTTDLTIEYTDSGANLVAVEVDTLGPLEVTSAASGLVTVSCTLPSYSSGIGLATGSTFGDAALHRVEEGTTDLSYLDPETSRFTCTSMFAGRVWYAGIDSKRIGNRVYFSQVLEGVSNAGNCYQEADPTSRHVSELIATDGGVITLGDGGRVLALMPFREYMIIFSSNGVWAVFGKDGIFDATAYGVRKLSDEIIIHKDAVTTTNGGLLFWSTESINVLGIGQTGQLEVSSITKNVLKNLVKAYGPSDWPSIKAMHFVGSARAGFVLPDSKSILWVDTTIGAFYKDDFKTGDSAYILGGFYDVTQNPESREKLVACSLSDGDTTWLAACYTYQSGEYVDFSETGLTEELDSHCIVGHVNGGDAAKAKQGTYMSVHMSTEADSSTYASYLWDYADDPLSNKYSNRQQCYRNAQYHSVSTAKLRVRGWGRSLQVKFENERGKPGEILGWDLDLESNATV